MPSELNSIETDNPNLIQDENGHWWLVDPETGGLSQVLAPHIVADPLIVARDQAKGVDPWTGNFTAPQYSGGAWGSDPEQIIADTNQQVPQEYASDYQKIAKTNENLFNIPWKTLLTLGILIVVVTGIHETRELVG